MEVTIKRFNRCNKSKLNGFSLFVAFAFLLIVSIDNDSAWGRAPITGKELAQQIYDRENGDDITAEMKMILINKRGRERVRTYDFYSKDYGNRVKQFNRFQSPADIKGAGFLSIEKEAGETEQFLYLPSQRRSRRIVSSQKSRSYVNSDFSYEDMERRSVEDYEHRISGDETIANINCYILESKPKDDVKSQYGRIKNWVDPEKSIPIYVEYFDRKEKLIKKYRVLKLQKIDDIWTEIEVVMENLKRRHKTVLKIDKIVYNKGLDDSRFSRQYLERIK